MGTKNYTIFLLTGKNKDGRKEDLVLAEYLKRKFDVSVSDITNAESVADKAEIVLIRNIWPTSHRLAQDKSILTRLMQQGVKLYNPGVHEEDLIGKQYLVALFKKGFPVIPTIDKKSDISLLGNHQNYFIKPKHGGSREGCKKVHKSALQTLDFSVYVVQPFIDFIYECSFYFIDNKLQYALYAPHKKKRWSLKPLRITRQDAVFAQRFVDWNALKYGIQRIDACRMKDGRLLLMEIEDWCPFISLLETPRVLREKFLKNLVTSLKGVIQK